MTVFGKIKQFDKSEIFKSKIHENSNMMKACHNLDLKKPRG